LVLKSGAERRKRGAKAGIRKYPLEWKVKKKEVRRRGETRAVQLIRYQTAYQRVGGKGGEERGNATLSDQEWRRKRKNFISKWEKGKIAKARGKRRRGEKTLEKRKKEYLSSLLSNRGDCSEKTLSAERRSASKP